MLPIHPLADLFPLIEGIEFDELVASIKAHGLYDPITLLEDTILDGRNRYRACQQAGVEPRFEDFDGEDPYAFVAAKNISRRHLTASQRGMIGARMAKLMRGQRADYAVKNEDSGIPLSVDRAAQVMGVSADTVKEAKTVLAEGTPEEIKSVEEGRTAVSSTAAKIRARRSQKKAKRTRRPGAPEPVETQHDRDLQFLRGAWDSACETARVTFIRGLGYPINDAA